MKSSPNWKHSIPLQNHHWKLKSPTDNNKLWGFSSSFKTIKQKSLKYHANKGLQNQRLCGISYVSIDSKAKTKKKNKKITTSSPN